MDLIHHHDTRRYAKIFLPMLIVSLAWILVGFIIDTPANVLHGLKEIVLGHDMLITDYIEKAGIGATFVNAGLVCLCTLVLLYYSGDPVNGFTLVVIGLMAGFSLFGKNVVNSLPILFGTWIYAKIKQEPFAKYVPVSLLATALSPLVSYLALHEEKPMPLLALLMGMLVGFVMPPLAAYTFRIQNGMNLYNGGFACGILGMVLVPILSAMDHGPESVLYWSTDYQTSMGSILIVLCLSLILYGTLRGKRNAWLKYWHILRTSGRLPSDYLRTFGAPPVCISMGINGLLGMLYILAVGGDLNGPTLGGIITIMSFAAYGKHAFNITPIMAGVLIGNLINKVPLNNPTMQLAGLFGTTLAPISGVFGWPFGLLAGFLHSSVVLYAGSAVGGLNLYNNGFSGGLIAIVLYPILTAVVYHRKPTLQDEEFYDILDNDSPLTEQQLKMHHADEPKMPH